MRNGPTLLIGSGRSIRRRGATIAESQFAVVLQKVIFTKLVFSLLLCTPAFALDPDQSITQYAHSAWTQLGNAPRTAVNAVAQTQDGYLWLGTEDAGLVRFDGERFLPWVGKPGQTLLSSSVESLCAAKQGGLWIGTRKGLVFWDGGSTKRRTASDGLGAGPVVRIYEEPGGAVWVATYGYQAGGLSRVLGEHIETFGSSDGLAGKGVYDIFRDHANRLWIGGPGGLTLWEPKPRTLIPGTTSREITSIAEGADGTIWLASSHGVLSYARGRIETHSLLTGHPDLQVLRVFVDRDGGVWAGTVGHGLFHFRQGRFEQMTRADGLSSDTVSALFEDREGNIWAGTANGLDKFRQFKVTTLSKREGLPGSAISSVVEDQSGNPCVGIRTAGLYCLADHRTIRIPDASIAAVFADRDGAFIVASRAGVYRMHGEEALNLSRNLDHVYSIVEDLSRALWFGDIQKGLFQWRAHLKLTPIAPDRFGGKPISYLYCDREGRVWIGLYSGGLMLYENNSVKAFSPSGGLGSGHVYSIFQDHDGGVWAATESGLSRYLRGRFVTLTIRNGLPCNAIQDILEDDSGTLWLRTGCGLVHAKLAQLERAAEDLRSTVPCELLGPSDGFRVMSEPSGTTPRAVKSRDGKLWFVMEEGLASVDPQRIPRNTLAPPVHIEDVLADDQPVDLAGQPKLAPTMMRLQIDYTGLSFADPQRVAFRYQLEGFDRDWVNAGTRRQAFYTNLRPGHYRFHVTASNNDGIWNEAGGAFVFDVEAAFLQTRSFAWICAGAGMMFLWAVYYVRLRQAAMPLGGLIRVYPTGVPGLGLMLLRIVVGFDLLTHATLFNPFASNVMPLGAGIPRVLEACAGLLLMAGLVTPVIGALLTLVVMMEMVQRAAADVTYAAMRGPWENALLYLVVLGSLTLLGPGAYSLDARLFGRRRVSVVSRNPKQ